MSGATNGTTVQEPPAEPPAREGPDSDAPLTPAVVRERAVRAVAHLTRTPLSLVVGPLNAVLGGTDLHESSRQRLEIARAQADVVTTEVEELAAIGTWPDQLDLRPGRLGDVLDDVARSRLAAATWRGLTYTIESGDTTEVMIDTTMTRWAVDVLLREAIEASSPDGHVVVRSHDADDGVVVSVVAQPRRGGALSVPGDGALVTVAKMVATLHGGTIRPGRSARWELEYPRCEAATARSSPTSSGSDETTPRSAPARDQVSPSAHPFAHPSAAVSGPEGAPLVLLVEDDAVLRGFLVDALSADHRVISATTAEEAITIVERSRPDLIALDLLLPGMSGDQLLSDLHGDAELAGIPVIVVSGRNDDEERARMLRDGVDDYLTKPFTPEELRARIQNVLARSGSLDDLRHRVVRAQEVAAQLQRALDSRVVIEQAKAFVAADRGITVDEAFEVLRRHARSHNQKLRELAVAVVDGFRP